MRTEKILFLGTNLISIYLYGATLMGNGIHLVHVFLFIVIIMLLVEINEFYIEKNLKKSQVNGRTTIPKSSRENYGTSYSFY